MSLLISRVFVTRVIGKGCRAQMPFIATCHKHSKAGTNLTGAARNQQIIIIRHGEKPDDNNNWHLSPEGVARSKMLVKYFSDRSLGLQAVASFPPSVFYAMAQTKKPADSKHPSSNRPYETIHPAAVALHAPIIQGQYVREDKELIGMRNDPKWMRTAQYKMAKDILANAEYNGKSIVICWEHSTLPDLMYALGDRTNEAAHGNKWPDVFDQTVLLSYDDQGVVRSTVLTQPALPPAPPTPADIAAEDAAAGGKKKGSK